MGDSEQPLEDWPEDDTDWVRLYFLSPNLWSDYLDEVESALEAGRAQPADLARFIERCLRSARCLSDFHAQLPNLGLDLWRFGQLRDQAVAAELAAAGRDLRARDQPPGGPLSAELTNLVVNLSLRGLDDDRIACALDIPVGWPELARRKSRLHARAADVVAAHLQGKTLGEISRTTGVPATSALRVLKAVGEQPHGAGVRVDARDRARTIVKLRDQGLQYKEIAQRLGCSMDVVKNVLRRDRRLRYRNR